MSVADPIADPMQAHERFRLASSAGNEAFSDGAHARACEHFEDALALARRLFQRAADGRACPEHAAAVLLVARQNAAQNLSRLVWWFLSTLCLGSLLPPSGQEASRRRCRRIGKRR